MQAPLPKHLSRCCSIFVSYHKPFTEIVPPKASSDSLRRGHQSPCSWLAVVNVTQHSCTAASEPCTLISRAILGTLHPPLLFHIFFTPPWVFHLNEEGAPQDLVGALCSSLSVQSPLRVTLTPPEGDSHIADDKKQVSSLMSPKCTVPACLEQNSSPPCNLTAF